MPDFGDLLWTSNAHQVWPADGSLVTCEPPAGVWANSPWAELVPAQLTVAYISGITVNCNGSGAGLSEVELVAGATGDTGSPVAIVEIVFGVPQWLGLPIPYRMDVGNSLFVRTRMASGLPTFVWSISAGGYVAPFTGHIVSTTTPLKRYPVQSLVTVDQAAVAWDNGPWATVIPSAPADLVLGLLTLYPLINFAFAFVGQFEIDVGIGSGTPSVVTTLRWSEGETAPSGFHVAPIWPLLDAIPSGTPVSVRIRSTGAGTNADLAVALHYYEKPLSDDISDLITTKPMQWAPPASAGTAMVVPASAWTSSDWEAAGTTTSEVAIVAVVPDSTAPSGEHEIDVGIDDGPEVVGTARYDTGFALAFGTSWPLLPFRVARTVETETDLSMRARSGNAAGGTISAVVGYITDPDFAQRTTENQQTYIAGDDGPSLVPAGTPWINTPWGELTPSTDGTKLITGVAINSQPGAYLFVEIGIAAAGSPADSEVGIGVLPVYVINIGNEYYPFPVPVFVDDAMRLSIRWRSISGVDARVCSATYIGVAAAPPTPEPPVTTTVAIRRVRRAPHLTSDGRRIFHKRIQFWCQPGIGAAPGDEDDPDPTMLLRWSNDGGHTWSNPREMGAGLIGRYTTRMEELRLGAARDRVYEVVVSDPNVAWCIVDAYVDLEKGTS